MRFLCRQTDTQPGSQHTVNVDSEAQNTPPVSPAPETSPNNTEEVPSVVRSMNEMELGHIPRRASDPGLSSERIDAPGKTARVIEQDVLPNSNLHGDVVREPVARESGAGSE